MLQDLVIQHRRKPSIFAKQPAPTWETCLRTLVFGTPTEGPSASDDVVRGADAYQFLLEIICGLHSPITGETEVMGQFKLFAAEWIARDPRRAPLVQRLLSDAKAIRAAHLSNLGTQSYGSWLRRHLTSPTVHVLGAGHLSREILPYLEKRGRVIVHTRRPVDVGGAARVRAIADHAFDGGALIIAAPLSAREVTHWLGDQRPTQVFDLRDTSSIDQIEGATSLDAIFKHIEQTKARLIPVLAIVRADIATRAERLASAEKLRPQGWDDLCA